MSRLNEEANKLAKEIAKFLYDTFNTTSKGSWEELPQFNETRQWWLSQANQLLALFEG